MCADYRQLVFENITQGMKLIIDAMDEWEMSVLSSNRVKSQSRSLFPLGLLPRGLIVTGSRSQKFIALVDDAPEIRQDQSFPLEYREPLELLWRDPGVQLAYSRGNEYALPESLP
jgi:guanine nucleotide-binding protein subunit alpha